MTGDEFVTLPTEPPRDRHGRPLIVPPDGGKPVPYTRASTFAAALDDAQGLTKWKLRQLALGLGRHDDLAALAGAYDYGDPKLDEVIETAIDRAGGTVKANWGTAVHLLTEPESNGRVPDRMAADVAAYRAELDRWGITVLDTERFVVNDDLQVAGTFDHLYDVPGLGVVVGDKKTGKLKVTSAAVQMAVYATGCYYRADDGVATRVPLGADGTQGFHVNATRGLLVHLPAGEAHCDLHVVDLAAAYTACQLAVKVRDFRNTDLAEPLSAWSHTGDVAAAFALDDLIATAPDLDTLNGLYFTHKAAWNADHTMLAKARRALLETGAVA